MSIGTLGKKLICLMTLYIISGIISQSIILLIFRKISFKNYEERVMASEKICTEADQLRQVHLITFCKYLGKRFLLETWSSCIQAGQVATSTWGSS